MQPPISNLVCTSYLGVNKKGIIRPNADGAYTCVIGGFNCFNNTEEYYELERSKPLFLENSLLQTNARNRSLKGEYGHPKPEIGQDATSFLQRALRIEETKVSHCFSKIWLEEAGRDRRGRPVVMVMGDVIPCGPYGDPLRKDFETPLVNVCFSVRALTDPQIWRRERRRVMTRVMTYDYVNLPGIEFATKYDSPTMEGFQKDVEQEAKAIMDAYDLPITAPMVDELVVRSGGQHALAMLSGDSPVVFLDQLRNHLRCDVVKAGSFNQW